MTWLAFLGMADCAALSDPKGDGGQGWPESQATPAATVDHVANACV